jgi:DNA-binding transcriptional LysR family regulator
MAPCQKLLSPGRDVDVAPLAPELVGWAMGLIEAQLEPDTHDRIIRACAKRGFTPRVTQEVSSLTAVIGLVAAGLGVAFVSASVADGMGRRGVVFRPLFPPALELTNGIAWLASHDNPAIANLELALREVVDEVA